MLAKWGAFISSERWDAVWLFVLTKAMVVGAAIPLTFAWKARTLAGTVFLVVIAAGLYLVAFVLDALVKASERHRRLDAETAAIQARTETSNTICNAFSGIPQHTTSCLNQVRSGDSETRLHLYRYFADVMESLTKAISAREPRVCLYLVDSAESPDAGDDGAVTLVLCGNGVGRSDPPRSAFDSSSTYGNHLIQRMNDRRALIVENTDNPPKDLVSVLDCADKYYKSFIAVPVTYNDHEYGMLMIDSPESGALTKNQQSVAHLFGRFMGSGFHMVQSSPASLPRLSVPGVSVDSDAGEG